MSRAGKSGYGVPEVSALEVVYLVAAGAAATFAVLAAGWCVAGWVIGG